jgi:hypothetical protein
MVCRLALLRFLHILDECEIKEYEQSELLTYELMI